MDHVHACIASGSSPVHTPLMYSWPGCGGSRNGIWQMRGGQKQYCVFPLNPGISLHRLATHWTPRNFPYAGTMIYPEGAVGKPAPSGYAHHATSFPGLWSSFLSIQLWGMAILVLPFSEATVHFRHMNDILHSAGLTCTVAPNSNTD